MASVFQLPSPQLDGDERGKEPLDILMKVLSGYLQTIAHSSCSRGDETEWELQS
jgi:hypothetical protein